MEVNQESLWPFVQFKTSKQTIATNKQKLQTKTNRQKIDMEIYLLIFTYFDLFSLS